MVLLSRAVRSVTGRDVSATFLECCREHGTPFLHARPRIRTDAVCRAIVLCEGTPSFRAVVNHAGLFWFSIYRFSVSDRRASDTYV